MKSVFYAFVLSVIFIVLSCGKAAEDRTASDARNKIIQDSMVNTIKGRMQEPFMVIYGQPNPPQQLQPVTTTSPATATSTTSK
ncbi:MAG: hypothetical protein LCH32_10425 [Bacteroidetes bacterium]|nr:hypothetical protein [Bacteroidota bacterium]